MQQLSELESRGLGELRAEGIEEESIQREISADLRYQGQSHELNVRLSTSSGSEISSEDLEIWVESFHREHEARFGHASRNEGVELVALRLRMTAPPAFSHPRMKYEGDADERRDILVWFDSSGPIPAEAIDRRGLLENEHISGPAVLWGTDATLLIPPGVEGACDVMGTVQLETS